jgi:hypothetical protein
VESQHACEARSNCVQLKEEDVEMGGTAEGGNDSGGVVLCQECIEDFDRSSIYCSSRCAAKDFQQHREAVHLPARENRSSDTNADAKFLVYENEQKDKYHADEIENFVWTLEDVLERRFKNKNPDLKILEMD